MELEEYVSSLPQDKLPPDGKMHPTRKKPPPSDAVKYIPKRKTAGGLTNFEEEKRKKRRQEMEAKLAVSETNNDVSESKLSRRSKEKMQTKMDEKRKEREMEGKVMPGSKSKPSESSSGGSKQRKNIDEEEDKYKAEMDLRLEKKTIIDKVTFFDKKTKRDIPEMSHDEKIGHDRDSMRTKILIILGLIGGLTVVAFTSPISSPSSHSLLQLS
ncbi:hypothetical protein PMAYCL1PPCAC_28592 [Pristionchus mayeri]|uniref:Uncharacterized protein n=1 Tax=Pristionchus mayeri TaxID=1317129 RepID=A0AAN5D9A3_9BILA|nr:hypothetical protein PMAYCL1PPCAC_28592 [Pristionchus mayeri]